MKYATDGIVDMDGNKIIELSGFLTDEGEVILSDSDSIGDWKPIKIKVEEYAIGFWLEQNEIALREICEKFDYKVNINN